MILPGETEARSAGRNHAEGSPGDRIDALEIPARRAEYSLTESARSPFQAEPTHCLCAHLGNSKEQAACAPLRVANSGASTSGIVPSQI